MAEIVPVVASGVPGTIPTWTNAAGGGDKLRPVTGVLLVRNGSASSMTVSVPLPGTTRYGQALPDPTALTIAAGAFAVIGPFESDLTGPDGFIDVTYSAVTTVTVMHLRTF